MALDALSDALGTLRLSAGMFPRAHFAPPWGVEVERTPCMLFHVMVRGRACLEMSGYDPIMMNAGDLMVVPRGDFHRVVSSDGSTTIELTHLLRAASLSEGGSTPIELDASAATLVCGFFELDPAGADLVLSCLPRIIRVAADDGVHRGGLLATTLEMVRNEVEDARPGSTALLDHLASVIFIQVLRAHLDAMPESTTGWLAGLADRRISAAMSRIHRSPQSPWSVDELATVAGMSRSAFTARFRELMGSSPTQYLTRWRMHRAAMLLRRDRLGVAEAAQQVGYESEATFAKAFKRHLGLPPGTYRETARESFAARLRRRSA